MPASTNLALEGISLVFDLDGTLVNTAPDLQAALNHVLQKYGYNPVLPEVSDKLIGNGAKAMLRAGLTHQRVQPDEGKVDLMFEDFLAYYAENIDIYSAPYPGCVACLDRLSQAGATLSVCTNKKQFLADQLLNSLGLADRFEAIIGADSVPHRKPDAGHILATLKAANGEKANAVMIGDSQTDEKAAHNAGLPFIFVPFGYGPISDDASNRHTLVNYDHLTAELVISLLSA